MFREITFIYKIGENTMLYGLLITLFVLVCALLVLIILIQKGKSSIGLGSLGGSTQMLFGGSGGQDLFQKITWALGFLFMAGSLGLAIMKKPNSSRFLQAIEQKNIADQAAQAQAKIQEAAQKAANQSN